MPGTTHIDQARTRLRAEQDVVAERLDATREQCRRIVRDHRVRRA
jgi:hypothetical protein